jgi:hypothetical protein
LSRNHGGADADSAPVSHRSAEELTQDSPYQAMV